MLYIGIASMVQPPQVTVWPFEVGFAVVTVWTTEGGAIISVLDPALIAAISAGSR